MFNIFLKINPKQHPKTGVLFFGLCMLGLISFIFMILTLIKNELFYTFGFYILGLVLTFLVHCFDKNISKISR